MIACTMNLNDSLLWPSWAKSFHGRTRLTWLICGQVYVEYILLRLSTFDVERSLLYYEEATFLLVNNALSTLQLYHELDSNRWSYFVEATWWLLEFWFLEFYWRYGLGTIFSNIFIILWSHFDCNCTMS